MNSEGYKEVYFEHYCKTCNYKDANEADDPCDECLSEPMNIYSHKPTKYVEKEKLKRNELENSAQ